MKNSLQTCKPDELFTELQSIMDLTGTLDQLGILLESHVRKEEQQFFQLIQESLEEEELISLGKALTWNSLSTAALEERIQI